MRSYYLLFQGQPECTNRIFTANGNCTKIIFAPEF
jgi:hypothetical protein